MLTFAFDLDGVTFPFTRAIAEWSASEKGIALPDDPDVWHYWRPELSDEDFDVLLREFGEAGGYRSAAPFPEALEGLGAVFDAGHEILGVTSRPPSRAVEASTYGWVADWFLPFRAVLIGPTAKLEAECDVVFDDDPAELAALDEIGEAVGVLVARPYNAWCTAYPRVDWSELPALVEVLADSVAGIPEGERRYALADVVG